MLEKSVKAELILENGLKFKGRAFGYIKESIGEVVFTTSMVGYQEILTDPSFAGKIVCMTYPLIGNYGINLEDMESDNIKAKGFIVKEKCDMPNNWRCEMELEGFLYQNRVIGIEGIDTRALTKVIRDNGTMKAIITTRVDDLTETQIAQKFAVFSNKHVVQEVTTKQKREIDGTGLNIAVLDLGIKESLVKEFTKRDCKVTLFPATTTASEILESNPDGIFISNGPGVPEYIKDIISEVKILAGKKPIFGVALGHQVLSIALGCETENLKYGHNGGNHPVKDIKTGKIYITNQSHQQVVTKLSENVAATYTNINDGSIEGIAHKTLPIFSVEFHPESVESPMSTGFLFDNFLDMIGGNNNA